MQIFEAKIRQVGSSKGVLIPNEVIEEDNIMDGQMVKVALLKKNTRLLEKAFGSVKGGSFTRDRKDREF